MDDLVAAVEHCPHVELAGHRLGRARDAPDLGERLRRPQERLRGHAGEERALAADEVPLDDRDLEPGLAEPPGADLARRAGADHDHIEGPLAHRALLSAERRGPPRRRPPESGEGGI